MTTTDEELMDEHRPIAGPSRPKIQPRTPKARLNKSPKVFSPPTLASRIKIKEAAEVRARLGKPQDLYEITGYSEVEGEKIPSKDKGKQRTGPIVEIQPQDSFTDSASESDLESIDTASSTPRSVLVLRTALQPEQEKSPTKTASPTMPGEKHKYWHENSAEKRWKEEPNEYARELFTAYGTRDIAQKMIRTGVKEPEYALRDTEIRDGLWKIMGHMENFSAKFFNHRAQVPHGLKWDEWFRMLTPETAKVIGCVASGGPAGVHGWHDLFISEHKRRALICAIIGNVLVEQVFQHTFFGAEEKNIDVITALQEKYRNEDGTYILIFV